MVHSDDVERILLEILNDKPPAVPDTPELAELRAKLVEQCREIEAAGGSVDVPHEIP